MISAYKFNIFLGIENMTEKESAHPSSRQLSELTLTNMLSPESEIVPGQPKSLETLLENKVMIKCYKSRIRPAYVLYLLYS